MNDTERQALVQQIVTRVRASRETPSRSSSTDDTPGRSRGPSSAHQARRSLGEGGHTSHVLIALPTGDTDGACLIEPSVLCTHCGYCRSFGH